MTRVTATETIDAPAETVFAAMTEIERFPDFSEDVLRVEFLTEQRSGPGTRTCPGTGR